MPASTHLFGGLSGVETDVEEHEFGHKVVFSKTYAHIFSANMAAFARPASTGQHHPAPWKAVKGGYSVDVTSQICVPSSLNVREVLNAEDIIWLIAALFRLARYPFLTVPVISDVSFGSIAESEKDVLLSPFELSPRLVTSTDADSQRMSLAFLEWVSKKWYPLAELLIQHPKLYSALKAFDYAGVRSRHSSSLLTMWGAIEQLFAPDRSELRFRVSSLLAAYLEPTGKSRKDLYTEIKELYNHRSIAAHSAKEIEPSSVLRTHVLLRNALMKIIHEEEVPTASKLDDFLFGVLETSDEWSLSKE